MNQNLKAIQDLFSQNNQLNGPEKEALLKALADADKQWSITEFKLDRTEKVKKTTTILLEETIEELEQKRKAVEAQNRELEIEAALEKVRAVAMGMRKQGDLSVISETIFTELKSLSFKDLRNTEIIINNDSRETVTSYYYSDYGVTGVIEIDYKTNPTVQAWVNDMKKADDAFVQVIIPENEMNAWREYREGIGYVADARLNEASTVYYYSYSIGLGALSISSFQPISEEQVHTLERFRNVFNLSYQRYADIALAEAQAREAEIELALERVRARTMAMHESNDLLDVINILSQQFQHLGFKVDIANFNTSYREKDWDLWLWVKQAPHPQRNVIPYFDHPYFNTVRECLKKGLDFNATVFTKEEKNSFQDHIYNNVLKDVPEESKEFVYNTKGFAWSIAFFKNTSITIGNYDAEPYTEEQNAILRRFGNVFEQSYTRFLDLQKAEAQARESQIQLALERVRARTMAMQRSDELAEAAALLFQQVESLGIAPWVCGFNIWDEDRKGATAWAADRGKIRPPFKANNEHIFLRLYEAAQRGESLYIEEIAGEALEAHYRYMKTLPIRGDIIKNLSASGVTLPTTQIIHAAYFSQGYLLFITYEPVPEAHDIFKRFAKVFEQTYTRFLDLQKAEAQARESQIQLALERVRARTMAMQNSDELTEAADLLFQQVQSLGIRSWNCGFHIWDEDKRHATAWMGTRQGVSRSFKTSSSENVFLRFYEAAQRGESLYVEEMSGEALQEHNRYMATLPVVGDVVKAVAASAIGLPTFLKFHVAYFSQGYLLFITREPCVEAHEIFKRFAKVFEQTYTRFLDLQKAEAQAREAKIEAALERVRSRSLAMHHSEELSEVVAVVFEKLQDLGFVSVSTASITLSKEGSRDLISWVARPGLSPLEIASPYFESSIIYDYWNAKEGGAEFFQKAYCHEEKNIFLGYLFEHTDFKNLLPDQLKTEALEKENYACSCAFAKNSAIFIDNLTGELLSEKESEILKRFARVFEQAYIRFLDLQKAETQAREAQIELGLERVRARAMAMHGSDELKELVKTLFEELISVDVNLSACLISTFDISTLDERSWMFHPVTREPYVIQVPYNEQPFYHEMLRAWKERNAAWNYCLEGETKVKWHDFLFADTEFALLPQSVIDEMRRPDKVFFTASYYSYGAIQAASLEPFPAQSIDIIERFSKVFDLSYTRFLDLQKAEAQAMEAQIETAMEKVRSRSLAMHKSDELQEVVHTVFEKLKELNVDLYTAIIFIFAEGSKDIVWWLANKANQQYSRILVPYADNPYLKNVFDAKENGKDFFSATYSFEEKNELFHHLFEYTDFKYVPEAQKKFLLESELATMSVALAKNTGINITSYSKKSFSEKDNEILKRFARVFEQAYIRFLDLQKAEAQAKEAQVEAALERVRARTMAMQHSDEMKDASALLFQQVKSLGAPAYSCGYNIWEPGEKEFTSWMSTQDGSDFNAVLNIPLNEDANFIRFAESREKGEQFFVLELRGERMQEHYQYLKTIPAFKAYFDHAVSAGFDLPETQIHHLANFSHGNLLFITLEPCPQFHEVFKRFAAVFDQTYTRFLDLQKAEAQALEAIKRASVDRVRAEIASMRTTNDLERITPLIWNELKTLGVPFIRCGVFIMDNERQQIETHLSTPDGEAIAAFNLPYNAPGETSEILAHWRKKEIYKQHWNEAQFVEFTQDLVQKGAITAGEKYFTENHPADLYLHFLPFLQGMLYAGNTASLSDDELQLMQDLADAFSTAYARYEDFNKLELAKEQIEKTLVDLKQAQQQLVQSEKMASLGELTAGIAHEIQNPLNFVNNFSEVNKEMLEELKAERLKPKPERDDQTQDEIINDLIGNEEKILHHGKRADAIVKGMLQHTRKSAGQKEPTDINALADEYLRLSYHGMRAKDKSFNATLQTDFDPDLSSVEGKINIIPQDIGRVLLNLYNNAFYAVMQKQKDLTGSSNLSGQQSYVPKVTIVTKRLNDKIEIRVADNGNGIPQNIVDKIYQPFFTTKPTGQGTGLGLSLSYDIIKAHGGEIKVVTKEARPPARLNHSGGDDPVGRGEGLSAEASDFARSDTLAEAGSEFIIQLPA